MAPDKPIFLLIPGAMHPADAYSPLLSALHSLGFAAQAIDLPTRASTLTIVGDIGAIRSAAGVLFEQGKKAILVMHSYGGLPGAAATEGMTVADRKEGTGGFAAVVFLAAYATAHRGRMLNEGDEPGRPEWADVLVAEDGVKSQTPIHWWSSRYADLLHRSSKSQLSPFSKG
jgi:pimeloyl-ACP methyl ester carboxylesterase